MPILSPNKGRFRFIFEHSLFQQNGRHSPLACHAYLESLCFSGLFYLSWTNLSASYKASEFAGKLHLYFCNIWDCVIQVLNSLNGIFRCHATISSPLTLLPSEKQMGTSKESRLFSVIKSTSSFFARFFFFFLTLSAQRRPILRAPSSSVEFFDTSIDLKKNVHTYIKGGLVF